MCELTIRHILAEDAQKFTSYNPIENKTILETSHHFENTLHMPKTPRKDKEAVDIQLECPICGKMETMTLESRSEIAAKYRIWKKEVYFFQLPLFILIIFISGWWALLWDGILFILFLGSFYKLDPLAKSSGSIAHEMRFMDGEPFFKKVNYDKHNKKKEYNEEKVGSEQN